MKVFIQRTYANVVRQLKKAIVERSQCTQHDALQIIHLANIAPALLVSAELFFALNCGAADIYDSSRRCRNNFSRELFTA